MKRVKINSDRNCSHCLFLRNTILTQDGVDIVTGKCISTGAANHTKYLGVLCEDFQEDPNNPIPRRFLTGEEKEARKYLKNKQPRTHTSIKIKRGKTYPKLENTKVQNLSPWRTSSTLRKNPEKQNIQKEILSDNKEVRKLTDQLFSLPKRSCKEGRKIRKQLRKLGFYLSKKGE